MSHVKLSSLRWMGGAMLTLALFLGSVPLQAVEEEQELTSNLVFRD